MSSDCSRRRSWKSNVVGYIVDSIYIASSLAYIEVIHLMYCTVGDDLYEEDTAIDGWHTSSHHKAANNNKKKKRLSKSERDKLKRRAVLSTQDHQDQDQGESKGELVSCFSTTGCKLYSMTDYLIHHRSCAV